MGCNKVPKVLKSFSHELGPKGGIPSAYPRPHSYNDLKVCSSLCKNMVNIFPSSFQHQKELKGSSLF